MLETKTYHFTFDPSVNKWQTETPRQWRKLGTSRTGLQTYSIRNIPEWKTRAELAREMPSPPQYRTHLDYTLRHTWSDQCN
jgi:hypothetical protein